MRVPANPDHPTYDHTFRVGFWQWFTSSTAQRKEWARRKRAAIGTGRIDRQLEAADDWAGRKQAEADAKRQAKRNK
jgi:hypothetical protein